MKKIVFFLISVISLVVISCDKDVPSDQNDSTAVVNNSSSTSSANITRGKEGRTTAGYEYVHHVNHNSEKPNVGDQVKYHKIVFKNDTTMLQSTYLLLEPRADILIPRDSVPQPPHPTYDALFLMSPGDSMTVYQHLDTFPKDRLPQGITNEDHFTYNIKMLSIKSKEVIDKEINAVKARHRSVADSLRTFIKDHKAGKLDALMTKTDSGLKYLLQKEGTGKVVKDGGFVKVHYLGMLEDGTIFDSSFPKATPFPTRIGRKRVIAGWDEGIPLLSEGGEATFFVPYELAYGVAGNPPGIPEKADLYFFVSLVNVY